MAAASDGVIEATGIGTGQSDSRLFAIHALASDNCELQRGCGPACSRLLVEDRERVRDSLQKRRAECEVRMEKAMSQVGQLQTSSRVIAHTRQHVRSVTNFQTVGQNDSSSE